MICDALDPNEVAPGTVLRVRKRFAIMADGGDATYPLVVVAGNEPGPLVALVAGIHGDEYEGPAALWRVLEQLDPERVRGRVAVVPVAHVAAFAAGTRASPVDGVNLARCFPGDVSGTVTLRLADDLFRTLVASADALVDLHSGGVRYAFAAVAGFYGTGDGVDAATAARSLRLASATRLDFLWRLPPRAGLLSFEAARRGVAVAGCEAGGRGGCLESDVAAYVAGIWGVLGEIGAIAAAPSPAPQRTHALDGDFALAPEGGFIVPLVSLGARVTAGAPLARIASCDGAPLRTLCAQTDGVVLAERHLRAIQPGEWATCALPELAL